jgi:hypothetical protein
MHTKATAGKCEYTCQWSICQIPSAIVMFVVLGFKVWYIIFIPNATRGLEPPSYRGVLLSTLLVV